MKIKTIKKSNTLEHTYDIEVPNVHHYILDNGCVSHNSSVVTNATNGIEPPRALVTTKVNKGSSIKIVVPSIKSLGSKYTLAWDITDNRCINELTCVMQKWVDQGISVNHYYNPLMYSDNKTPAKVVIKDIVDFFKYGGKNLYYANTLDTLLEDETAGCEGGGCTL